MPSTTFHVPLPEDDRLRTIADALIADPADQRDLAASADDTRHLRRRHRPRGRLPQARRLRRDVPPRHRSAPRRLPGGRIGAFLSAWIYAQYVAKADEAQTPANEVRLALLSANVDMVLRIHRAGGFVIAGTDAPLDNPAVSLHANLRAKVRFGFTPYEALTTATRNPARWLGLAGKLGEVRRGARADLSFVEGDPLTDIRAAAAVRMVMVGGELHTIDDLVAPFAAPAPVPALATRAVPAEHRHDDEFWWHEPEWAHHYCG